MKVYSLDQNEEYAAQSPCGIFSTREKAVNAAIAKCKNGYTIIEDMIIGRPNYILPIDNIGYWWYDTNYYGDEPSFYVSELEVQ